MSVRAGSVLPSSQRNSLASSVSFPEFASHNQHNRQHPHDRQSCVSLPPPGDHPCTLDASELPDFAFLGYPTIPPRPEAVSVRDEASWSYSGPLLDLTPTRDQAEDEIPRVLPESFYDFAASTFALKNVARSHPALLLPQRVRGYYSDSESDDHPYHAAQPPIQIQRPAPHSAGEVLSAALIPFLLFTNAFLAANGVHHYWITVRATRPNREFDRPRWHTDDFFWDTFQNLRRPTPCDAHRHADSAPPSKKGRGLSHIHQGGTGAHRDLQTDWKLCTTLLGPPTLFIPLPYQPAARSLQQRARAACTSRHVCTSVRCVGCTTAAEAVRGHMDRDTEWMGTTHHRRGSVKPAHGRAAGIGGTHGASDAASIVSGVSAATGATGATGATDATGTTGRADGPGGECAFFRIGEQCGAVHSEPGMHEDRVFVNVVPAREDELRKLMSRWGMQYPRDWWVPTKGVRMFPMGTT